VQALLRLSQAGLAGMIVGKALYDGSIVFREALDLVQRG
jgi:phosphoribosylformimino-5-aminoimidazole carboxamide ribonucleotide (ProFAR) isomerase